jgi:acyl-[acyl-carrier-protein]-phospholipid O-acyltransferase/long-chain-fatty-acid--[acyl-carrier-protein] ligase
VAIAAIGTITSLLIRRVPPARPELRFEPSAATVPHDMRRLLRQDRPLLVALIVSSTFWLVAGVANSAVNSLGKIQLQQDDFWTSILLVCIGVGIAAGAVVAGLVSRGRANFRVVRVGVWGMLVCLVLLSLPGIGRPHLLGYWGSLAALVLLGMCAGMFAIPIQVFLQARPPEGQKGRMIAVMNQANFAAILLASPVYLAFDRIVNWLDWPRSPMLAFTALMMLPVALFYRPKDESLG